MITIILEETLPRPGRQARAGITEQMVYENRTSQTCFELAEKLRATIPTAVVEHQTAFNTYVNKGWQILQPLAVGSETGILVAPNVNIDDLEDYRNLPDEEWIAFPGGMSIIFGLSVPDSA